MKRSIKFIWIAFFANLLYSNLLWSQKDSVSNETKSSLTVESVYSTNTNFFGNLDDYLSQPSFTNSLTFKSKKNFGLTISPIFIGNSDSTYSRYTAELDLGASYSFTLWEMIYVSPSYKHYFYGKNSASLKSGFNNYAEIATSFSLNWWDIFVSSGYGWGHTSDFILNPGTDATIQFTNFLAKNSTLTLQPTVSFSFNKLELTNYINNRKLRGLEDIIKLYPNMTASEFLSSTDPAIVLYRQTHPLVVKSITNRLKKVQNSGSGKKPKSDFSLSGLISTSSKFELTSINISLPISYSFKNLTVTGNLQYNNPNNQTDPSEFYFSFGISYKFGLKR